MEFDRRPGWVLEPVWMLEKRVSFLCKKVNSLFLSALKILDSECLCAHSNIFHIFTFQHRSGGTNL
jgi:hypothetical protein